MLIISGADLVGKSTFAKKCVELLQERGYSHVLAHLSRPPASWDYCDNYIERMAIHTVWDRFALDSLAYRQCDDHPCSMTPLKWDLVQAAVTQHCGFQVVLVSSPSRIRELFAKRGDAMYDVEHIIRVNTAFETMAFSKSPFVDVRAGRYWPRIHMAGNAFSGFTPELVVDEYCDRLKEFIEL